ncbi:MAG: phosphatase PAP2 family protein [Saprospiraceae bacterium]|nr:phosphatase PAP2 family protein [Saprospiraceae bacterium]
MTDLLQFDENLFYLVNSGCQNQFFDWLMPLLRDKYIWLPLYVFIGSFLLLNFKQKGLYLCLAFVLTVGIADGTSSQLIKKNVQRLRPCKVLEPRKDMHLLVPCGSGFSFPSSHATNHFAIATYLFLIFGKFFRWIKIPLVLWASSIAFAQVYVGVHYPMDVIVGALLGFLIGWGVYTLLAHLPFDLALTNP